MEQGNRPIPNRLRMHRKLLRYNQAHVAKILGLRSTASLIQWEKGLALPNGENLIKLSIVYRTIPNELYLEYFQKLKAEIKQKEFDLFELV